MRERSSGSSREAAWNVRRARLFSRASRNSDVIDARRRDGRAKTVIDVDDGHPRGATIQHREERGEPVEGGSVTYQPMRPTLPAAVCLILPESPADTAATHRRFADSFRPPQPLLGPSCQR